MLFTSARELTHRMIEGATYNPPATCNIGGAFSPLLQDYGGCEVQSSPIAKEGGRAIAANAARVFTSNRLFVNFPCGVEYIERS